MKGKRGKKTQNNSEKLFAFVLFTIAAIFGLIYAMNPNVLSSILVNRNLLAANDVPEHKKVRTANTDKTYTLSLDVKGDAEKKPQNVNIIVIVDRSGSMSTQSGTGNYVPSNENGTNMYGLVDGKYVPLERRGTSGNRTFWYNGVQYTGQRYQYDATATRMQATRAVVNGLADALLSYNGKDGNADDTVEMALVSFATNAQTNVAKTTDKSTFETAVNGLSANGGTNWEAALQQANSISFGDTDPTYVIFFSDGSPTFHASNGGYGNWNNTYNVYGSGHEEEPNMERSYTQAVDDATTLATKVGKANFYTIFAYGTNTGSTYMKDLTTAAGAPATNNYSATSTAELQDAFDQILENIEMAGIGNVEIVDGTTNKVVRSDNTVANLLTVDESSFRYYKNGEDWVIGDDTPELKAKLDPETGEVVWDLSSLGVLENDVTYTVKFEVYPSQETYDLIADLKNGTVKYNDLDENVKKYLKEDGKGGYTLATNTEDVTLYYNDTRVDAPNAKQRESAFNILPNVDTDAYQIDLVKKWENVLDAQAYNKDLILTLIKDGVKTDEKVVVGPDNSWADSIYVATGLMKTIKDSAGNITDVKIYNSGHDYSIEEPSDMSYYWELEIETVHPMIIDGQLRTVVKTEDPDVIAAIGNKNYVKYNGHDVFKISYKVGDETRTGVYYVRQNQNTHELRAINNRKSNFNILKKVTGDALPGQRFDFTFTVNNSTPVINEHDDDIWFSICNTEIDSTCKSADSLVMEEGIVTGAAQEEKNGEWTGYYYANNKANITAKLENNWNIRVINLGTGSTFTVEENGMPNGFNLDDIKADTIVTEAGTLPIGAVEQADGTYVYTYRETGASVDTTITYRPVQHDGRTVYEYEYTPTVEKDKAKVSGKIVGPNTVYEMVYTNNYPKTNLVVKKEWFKTVGKSVKVQLYQNGTAVEGKNITLDGTKDELDDGEDGETDSWVGIFTNLEVKDQDGNVINYSAKEEVPSGYEASYASSSDIVVKATNVPTGTEAVIATVKVGEETKIVTLTKDSGFETIVSGLEFVDSETGDLLTVEVTPAEGFNGTLSYVINNRTETITNSEITKVTVTKTWVDSNNQDGLRASSGAKVALYANGSKVDGSEVTVGTGDNWSKVYENLPVYDEDGKQITYSVQETLANDSYTKSGDDKTLPAVIKDSGTIAIKNTHTPIKDKITVTKVWEDEDDQDGIRPDDVDFTITGSDNKTYPATLTGDGKTWTAEVEVDKYYNEGQEVKFTVDEEDLSSLKYSKKIDNDKLTITNTYTPVKDKITVTKVWEDNNDQDGIRPDDVEFTVTGSNGKTYPATLTGDGKTWTAEVEVDKYYNGGQEVTFTVDEEDLSSLKYSKKIDNDKLTITNTYEPETEEITVTKVWEDNNDQDGIRPDDVDFTITGSDGNTYPATLSGSGKTWTTKVKVSKYYNGGQEVTFTVDEEDLSSLKYSKKIDNDKLTITNTYTPIKDKITVTKIWEDNNDQDGIRPDDVDFTITGSNGKTYPATLSGSGKTWTAEVEVDKYYNGGEEVTFTVDEEDLSSLKYSKKIDNDKLTITNTYTPIKDKITVTKIWEDNNDQDGIRPDDVDFTITGSNGKTYPATLSGSGKTWTAEVEVDKYYNGGEEVTFTVDEEDLSSLKYSKKIDNDKLTITNTYTPVKDKLTVTKIWEDNNDQDGIRPDDVDFTITGSNGKSYPATLTGEGKTWTAQVEVDKYYNGGQEVTFTVDEEDLSSLKYKKSIDNDKLTITNTYTPEKDFITVTKIWEDNNDQDGIRPDDVDFTITGSDNKTYPATLSGSGKTWTAEVEVDKYYNGGEEVTFTVDEEDLSSLKYSKKIDNDKLTITNTYTPVKDKLTVTKIWEDNNDQDGIRPDDVDFTITGSDNKTYPATLSGSGKTWTAEVEVDKYYNGGQEVTFTVDEEDLSSLKYKKSIDNGKLTITNTYTPQVTKVTVNKTWDDSENVDGYRSKVNARVQLWKMVDGKASKVDGKTATVPTTDGEVTVFENLPVFEKGNPITYYVEETMDKVEGKDVYNVTGDATELVAKEGDSGKIALVNTHTPDTINIEKGYKVWKDTDNQDGMRPEYIIVNVNSDDPNAQNPVKTVRVDGKLEGDTLNRWSYSVNDLPRYRDQGQEIHYSVTESYPEGFEYAKEYEFSIDSNDKYTIINTHNTKTTEVEVTKKWEDTEDQDGLRPDSITLTLYANGDEVERYTNVEVTPQDGNKMNKTWTYKFTGLDMYKDGKVIVYTVAETPATDGYNVDIVYSNNNYKADITNTHTPSKLTIKGTKVWDDNTDEAVMRPEYINVRLTKNGNETDNVQKVTAEGNWSFTFSNLDEFENHGEKIVYGVKEEYPEDYEFTDLYQVDISDISKEGTNTDETSDTEETSESEEPIVKENNYIVTVTNKYVPEYVSITMNKIWDDENNNDGIRPQYITVNLLADGELIKSEKVTEADGWKVSFTDLPKYKNHKVVIYTITEDVVENYKSVIVVNNDNTEFTITNKHDPEKTKINGSKTWKDDEKHLDKRPSSITIKVYADGVYLQTITVSNQTNWQYYIDNLYKYKNGKEITYTVVEDEVEDYTSVVNGYNIINYFTGGEGETVPPNTSVDNNTGNVIIGHSIGFIYMFLATLILGSLRRFVKINN